MLDVTCLWSFSLTIIWCYVFSGIILCQAFNVETDYVVVHTGPAESMFGFSVAQHRDTFGSWILVGAPEATSQQPNVTRGGSVYKCHPQQANDCELVPFDLTGNERDGTYQVDYKDHQWFGATVASRSGVMLACAPRYVWYSSRKDRRDPIGRCFYLAGGRRRETTVISPCATGAWGFHRQGSCQAGFSAALSKDGNRLYIGAVGSWYWQGQVFFQNLLNSLNHSWTGEGPTADDMAYLGYSMALGHFDSDHYEDLAVGMPRGNQLSGRVLLLDTNLNSLYNISGDQLGSYFGYSVAVADLDGDGLHDVVVGAPWFSDEATDGWENGMVATFLQTPQHNFYNSTRITGRMSRSHLGLSVVSLKDLNLDGFEDVAAGAPHDGPGGKGSVFIFLGSERGIRMEPSQILYPEEHGRPLLTSTFGWSLEAGMDLDNNQYPDLVVGAYESTQVFVFRTRPVLNITSSLRFLSGGAIDLAKKGCSLQDSTLVSCVPLYYCLSYTGIGVPGQIEVSSKMRLDTLSEQRPRLFFLKKEGLSQHSLSVALKKNVEKCNHLYTYVTPEPKDKLTPLMAALNFDLGHRAPSGDRRRLRPVVGRTAGRDEAQKASIYIRNNCGQDNICVTDLVVNAACQSKEYVRGSKENLVLNVRLQNRGEEAYQSELRLDVPLGAHFVRYSVEKNTAPDDVTPFCSVEKEERDAKEVVICEVGNPLPSDAVVDLQLLFQPDLEGLSKAALDFRVWASSASLEREAIARDNEAHVALPVVTRTVVDIGGLSLPEGAVELNTSSLSPSEEALSSRGPGPEVTHIYDVSNRGPSDIPRAEIFLLWPSRTHQGRPLLYLVEQPSVSSALVTCDAVSDLNYYHFNIVDAVTNEVDKRETKGFSGGKVGEITDVAFENFLSSDSVDSEALDAILSCGQTNCTRIHCTVTPFEAGQHFTLQVRSWLWVDTIRKLALKEVAVSSRLVVIMKNSPDPQTPHLTPDDLVWNGTVSTIIRSSEHIPTGRYKWLIILGSIIVGLLVLALLSKILYMLGFFKRRRHQQLKETDQNSLSDHDYISNGKL